jgi:FlaA1/EpsC-like NDP-sugar epimerase
MSFLGFFALSFFLKEEAYSRVAFALTGLFSIASLTFWRVLTIQGGRFINRIMGGIKRVAIIGDDERARRLAELIEQEHLEGYEFVGFIGLDARSLSPEMRQNLIGDLLTLPAMVRKAELQGVIIAVEEGAFQTAVRILSEKSSPTLEVKLLVGDPSPNQIALIDLNFGK